MFGTLLFCLVACQQKTITFYKADVVFIKLGTNDSKSQNRVHLNDFEADYSDLINSFKRKNKDARIILLLPVPAFTTDTTRIWDQPIKNKIIPATQKVAYKTNSEVLDLYHLLLFLLVELM